MIKKLVSHLGEYKRAAILTPIFSALEAIMDVLLPTIMAFIIDLGIEKGDMNAVVKYGLLTFLVAAIALLLGVLAGEQGPAREIVCLNAGVALYAANVVGDIAAGIARARAAIDSGAAKAKLEQLVTRTHALAV